MTMKITRAILNFFAVIFASTLLCSLSYASLMIKPSRAVLDEKNRSVEITLLNNSTSTKEYHIEWDEKVQTISGAYTDIDKSASKFSASDYIQHSPKKVTIEPGKYQKIKLRLRLPRELADGEYRSHLMMRVVNDVKKIDLNDNTEGKTMRIVPLLSFSIPIMVRKGNFDSEAKINSIKVTNNEKNKKQLQVNLAHTGKFSTYGNLIAYAKVGNKPAVKIGETHNIALFRETQNRIVNIPLQVDNIPNDAAIQVIYQGEDEFEGQILGKAAIRY